MRLPLLFLILWTSEIFGQIPEWEWAQTVGQKNDKPSYPLYNTLDVDRFGNTFILELHNQINSISKYDSKGNRLWRKEIAEKLIEIEADNDGNLYAVGSDNTHALVMKLTPNGNSAWAKKSISSNAHINALSVRPNNNVVFGGNFYSSIDFEEYQVNCSYNSFLGELDSDGALKWIKSDTSCYYIHTINEIKVAKSGNIYASYTYTETDNYWSLKRQDLLWLDSFGNYIANRAFDVYPNFCVDDSSNLFVGYVNNLMHSSPYGYAQCYVAKYVIDDGNYQAVWTKEVGRISDTDMPLINFIPRPRFGPNNTLFVTGTINSAKSADGKVVIGPDTIYSKGDEDLIVSQLNRYDGEYLKTYHLGSRGKERITDFDVDVFGNVYAHGYHLDTLCFNNSTCLVPKNNNVSFVAKLKLSNQQFTDAVGLVHEKKSNLRIYPNPASDAVSLILEGIEKNAIVEVINTSGQRVTMAKLSEYRQEINVSSWNEGMYLFILRRQSGQSIHKVIISH